MKRRPISTLIEPVYFVADGVFATKAGEVGIGVRFHGPDPECMEDADKNTVTRRWQKIVGTLGDCRVYQYLLKSRNEDGVFTFETYMVLLSALKFDRTRWTQTASRAAVSTREAAAAIRERAISFQSQADFVNVEILSSAELWRLFKRLLNYDPVVAGLTGLRESARIDTRVASSQVEVHRTHLRVGDRFVKVLVLKDPPSSTAADFLRGVRQLDSECIAVVEWKVEDSHKVRNLIHSKTKHFHQSKYNVGGVVSSVFQALKNALVGGVEQQERPENMQQDKAASAHEEELGDLIKEIETKGSTLGTYAMTLILHDAAEMPDTYQAFRAFASNDATLYEEKVNALSAWIAAFPGGYKHQFRNMYLTDSNAADMSMPFSVATGEMWNPHLNAECLAVLDTRQKSRYFLNLHVGDVFHTAFIGQTGSGKSFTASWLLEQARGHYNAHIVIFDIGGSYRKLMTRTQGSYMDLGLDNPFTMAPFALPLTNENIIFLHAFVRVLMESNGYRMQDPRDDGVIEKAIRAVYLKPVEERRLAALELPDDISPYLDKWRGGGRYASLFDNVEDTLTTADLQVFDFERLDRHKEVLEPFLFYVFHRMSQAIEKEPGRLKIFLVDECWKFLTKDSARAYIREAFKTFRKKNAGIWIATQSLEDLVSSGMDDTVIENCASTIFLPNPGMKADVYQKAFHLNAKEIDAILTMTPKCEWLLRRPDGSKILQLNVKKPKEIVCIEKPSLSLSRASER